MSAAPRITPTGRQAMIGVIGTVLVLSIGALLLRAAAGAYADDYELVAQVERPGFNLDDTSTVKIRGVTVGGIKRIELLDSGIVELTLHLRKEVRVPESATARIEPLSVFGPKFVDIIPGPDETEGPFLRPGDHLADTVAPSEVVETLDGFATVLESFDPEKLGIILTELARGLGGLGEDLGATVTAADQLSRDFIANREEVDRLLASSVALGDTLEPRGQTLVRIAETGASVLDLLSEQEDQLADSLQTVAQLASDLALTIDTAAPGLAPLVVGLDRVTAVIHAQLGQLPTFLASNERIGRFLGEDLIQWDIGDGRMGGITRVIVELDPCVIVPTTPGCAPPRGSAP